jgi:putative sigma-54 modulation protein
MDLQIEGRHFKVTDAIKVHLEEKLGKLEHFYDGIFRIHVVLGVEKTRQHVELICHVAKRHTLVAKGDAEDMYVAIDKAEKKMVAEMKKFKAKLRSESRRQPGIKTLEAAPVAEEPDEESV